MAVSRETSEEQAWRFASLHPPGRYMERPGGRVTVWDGGPRYVVEDLHAEWNAAAQLRALGDWGAELTPTNTVGIDIRSPNTVAQVKCESTKTGLVQLQSFYEACQCSFRYGEDDREKEKWFFSASGYTKWAVDYADYRSILLFTYSVTGDLTPVNGAARVRYDQLLKRLARRAELREKRRSIRNLFPHRQDGELPIYLVKRPPALQARGPCRSMEKV